MNPSEEIYEGEFRVPIGIVILLQVIMAMVYIIPIESNAQLSAQFRFRYFEPILYLTPFLTVMLYSWRAWVGRWFAALAPAVIIFAIQSWLPIPGSLALLAISTGLAAGLIGPRSAIGTAVGSLVGLVALRAISGAPDAWQIGIAFTAILTMLVLVLSIHHAVKEASTWNRNYYQEAMRILQENRAQQGELQQALADLAHANRQMTLLYEKQTVLQRIAEEAEHTKSSFVAKVSHEFRTPLNMIIGLASVMIENPRMYGRALPAGLLEDLHIIYRNCDHLASLVNDVLSLSQLQSGNVVMHRENLDLAEIIKNALEVVRPLINQKKLSLTLELPDRLDTVYCDRTRIRQVILNLLSNAARFTDQGGIIVHVTEQDKQVVIAVTDTGPGIPQADMERIFEPFCQGSEQVWREKGGSGLGLTISKQFVELHGGRIWLESQVGAGTTFFVALPKLEPLPPIRLPAGWINPDWKWVERKNRVPIPRLPDRPRVVIYDPTQEIEPGINSYADQVELVTGESMEDVIAEVQKTPAHAVLFGANSVEKLLPLLQTAAEQLPDTPLLGWVLPQRMSPALRAGADSYLVKPISLADLKQRLQAFARPMQHILIVDDDDETRQLLARMLALYDASLSIHTAPNGKVALQMLKSESFDLLLLDLVMPEINGLQVMEQVRSDPATQDLPVIVISGQDLYETQPVCTEMLMSMGNGIQLAKALECAVGVSQILFMPVAEPHPTQG
jgi:signal transduction histidine kinase/CheY-like chemotaxis protein